MATPQNTAELKKQKPSVLEHLDDSLRQEAAEGMRAVQEAAGEVQGDVAEVMGGLEKPKEKISERAGERGEKGDLKAGGGALAGDDDQTVGGVAGGKIIFPPVQVMARKVVVAIRDEIKLEMKRAAQLEKKIAVGGAKDYNESIARIRTLKSTLQSVLEATVDFLKDLYTRYVIQPKDTSKATGDSAG